MQINFDRKLIFFAFLSKKLISLLTFFYYYYHYYLKMHNVFLVLFTQSCKEIIIMKFF